MVSFQNCSPVAFKAKLASTAPQVIQSSCISDPNSASCTAILQCQFNGKFYNENETVKAYLQSSVPNGQTCASEERRCQNGTFAGSYAYAECEVGALKSCLFNGKTIRHGESTEAYQSSSVAYGDTCQKQVRVCNDGSLSGGYIFPACQVGPAATCFFNGQTIASGQSVTAYATSSVPSGQTCASEVRTCQAGVLSGSYVNPICVVNPAVGASCSVSLSPGSTLADTQILKVNVSSSNAQNVQVNCGFSDGFQNLENKNGTNEFGPFPAGSYTCQFRASNSAGQFVNCNPATIPITVTTSFACPATAPLYAGTVSLGKNVSLSKAAGNTCACANPSVLTYDANLNRCLTACPAGSILTNNGGVYQCTTCKPATVTGRNGTHSVEGVVVENTCAYSGLLKAVSPQGVCYLENAMIGWPSGFPTTLSNYNNTNAGYGSCRIIKSTTETAFLQCQITDPNITDNCGGGGTSGGTVGGGGFNNSGVPGN